MREDSGEENGVQPQLLKNSDNELKVQQCMVRWMLLPSSVVNAFTVGNVSHNNCLDDVMGHTPTQKIAQFGRKSFNFLFLLGEWY